MFESNSIIRRLTMAKRMGRLKRIHLVLMLGISLLIPLFLAYSLYVDLSGTVLLSSDMSFEDPEDEDLSTCQNEFKAFVPTLSFNPLLPGTHFGWGWSLFSSPLTSRTQITPILRC
jgi:hypothetical protein